MQTTSAKEMITLIEKHSEMSPSVITKTLKHYLQYSHANSLDEACEKIKKHGIEKFDIYIHVCNACNIGIDRIGPGNKTEGVLVRQITTYLFSKLTYLSPKEMADFFCQDRTVFYHSIKVINYYYEKNHKNIEFVNSAIRSIAHSMSIDCEF